MRLNWNLKPRSLGLGQRLKHGHMDPRTQRQSRRNRLPESPPEPNNPLPTPQCSSPGPCQQRKQRGFCSVPMATPPSPRGSTQVTHTHTQFTRIPRHFLWLECSVGTLGATVPFYLDGWEKGSSRLAAGRLTTTILLFT